MRRRASASSVSASASSAVFELGAEALQGADQLIEGAVEGGGGVGEGGGDGVKVAGQVVAAGFGGAGEDLGADGGEQAFRGAVRLAGQAGGEPGAGQDAGGGERILQMGGELHVVADHGFEAEAEAFGAGAGFLGAEQPAPEQRALDAGEFGAERAVRGVEQMVALVEHIARGHGGVVEAAPAGL